MYLNKAHTHPEVVYQLHKKHAHIFAVSPEMTQAHDVLSQLRAEYTKLKHSERKAREAYNDARQVIRQIDKDIDEGIKTSASLTAPERLRDIKEAEAKQYTQKMIELEQKIKEAENAYLSAVSEWMQGVTAKTKDTASELHKKLLSQWEALIQTAVSIECLHRQAEEGLKPSRIDNDPRKRINISRDIIPRFVLNQSYWQYVKDCPNYLIKGIKLMPERDIAAENKLMDADKPKQPEQTETLAEKLKRLHNFAYEGVNPWGLESEIIMAKDDEIPETNPPRWEQLKKRWKAHKEYQKLKAAQ